MMAGKGEEKDTQEDDFDYSVSFASPGISKPFRVNIPANEYLEGTEIYVDKEPVVFLLGWMGCKEKHLAKFNSIYSKRCITIRYTAPRDYILYEPEKLEEIAKKLLGIVFDLGYQDNPIFIHAFSNGGGSLYRHMSNLLQHDSFFLKLKMCGAIFDSLPAQETATAAYLAVVESHHDLYFPLRYLLGISIAICIYAENTLKNILSYFGFWKKPARQSFSEFMYEEAPVWPSLYLYSKTDAIVNHCHVESVIQHRKQLGANITSIVWEDCPHVQLYKQKPTDYAGHCQQFIQQCLFASIFEDSEDNDSEFSQSEDDM